MKHKSQIVLFQSPPEACSYLDNRVARNVYADPFRMPTMDMYNALIQKGFRRSGHHIYRPHCDNCNACISVRIPVDQYQPNRAQRRAWKANSDLTRFVADSRYTNEYFALYKQYLSGRHPGAGMDNPEKQDFERFLISDWCETVFCELRLNDKLLCVAVTDIVNTGLSSVYTYFDPDLPQRSLGTTAIMMQIELARTMKLPYVYLGYWIEASEKMKYKSTFKIQEKFVNDRWV